MDLLKAKYNSLDASCSSEFEIAAKAEVDKNAAERLKILNDVKVVCAAAVAAVTCIADNGCIA
jgi:hypothetical protein